MRLYLVEQIKFSFSLFIDLISKKLLIIVVSFIIHTYH